MMSFTGQHITREYGAPSIRDMSVQGMRIVRFAGAYDKYFWPIGMHSLLVADIANWYGEERLEHHMLLHDVASECSMCDIPRPMKTAEQKTLEEKLARRTYKHLGLKYPTKKEQEKIHNFDMMACNSEGYNGCGPRGYSETQIDFRTSFYANNRLGFYLTSMEADYSDLLKSDGFWPLELEKRIRLAIRNIKG